MARNARFIPFFLLLMVSGPSHGQIEPVVVTATRTAQTVDAALAPVSVIDREEIEALQPVTVSDILRTVPGLSVSNTGGLGQPSAVFLRGAEFDHVLVLIDGVKAGSATLGSTAFQFLDPDQIERIEVVRGPRSSLYGPDAIGGVIQIFTRDPAKAPGPPLLLPGEPMTTPNSVPGSRQARKPRVFRCQSTRRRARVTMSVRGPALPAALLLKMTGMATRIFLCRRVLPAG